MKSHIKNQEQKNVNAKGFSETLTLNPAGYHLDRARNMVFGLSTNVIPKERNLGLMPPTEEFKRLVTYFQPDHPSPAGGWYLVKEQRDWLKENLIRLIRARNKEHGQLQFHILEAGIASFNHHFSYLTILKEVLDQIGIPGMKLNITVTDKAYFPLFCIDQINKASLPLLLKKKEIQVFNNIIPLSEEFLKWIVNTEVLLDDRLKVRTKQYDLTDSFNTAQLGKFDFVTEHFITAVIDNFNIIDQIRKTYSVLLNEKGYLLDASGITPHIHAERFDQFLEIHEKYNLEQSTGQINVWDPYGMRSATLLQILEDKEIEVPFDNGLFIFQKKEIIN